MFCFESSWRCWCYWVILTDSYISGCTLMTHNETKGFWYIWFGMCSSCHDLNFDLSWRIAHVEVGISSQFPVAGVNILYLHFINSFTNHQSVGFIQRKVIFQLFTLVRYFLPHNALILIYSECGTWMEVPLPSQAAVRVLGIWDLGYGTLSI